jgi:hypothetical protein
MYMTLNDAHYQTIPANTDFAAHWYDHVFADGNSVETYFNQEDLSQRYYTTQKHGDQLRQILDINNEMVTREGFPTEYLYEPVSRIPSPQELIDTHEKWADYTKQKFEADVLDPDHEAIYDALNQEMTAAGMDYRNINDFVHQVEFRYKFFMLHGITVERPGIHDYTIQPSDTGFRKDLICLPYYDVGRPQFEKYQLCNVIDHPEISNYKNIARTIEITAEVRDEPVPQVFYDRCAEAGVPAYGNYVAIARNVDQNPGAIGYFFIKNFRHAMDNVLTLQREL